MSTSSSVPTIFDRPISHISYMVNDIPAAVGAWVSTFGAGPFYLLEHMEFDETEHNGAPVAWDHSAAFGQWGPIAVELQQIHSVEPPSLAQHISGHGYAVNHVSYIVENPEEESARLEALGMPRFLYARFGPVEVTFHDVPWLSHAIEIHKDVEFINDFFGGMAKAAEGWDGTDPLRSPPEA